MAAEKRSEGQVPVSACFGREGQATDEKQKMNTSIQFAKTTLQTA
jgi:hypothetical protein